MLNGIFEVKIFYVCVTLCNAGGIMFLSPVLAYVRASVHVCVHLSIVSTISVVCIDRFLPNFYQYHVLGRRQTD